MRRLDCRPMDERPPLERIPPDHGAQIRRDKRFRRLDAAQGHLNAAYELLLASPNQAPDVPEHVIAAVREAAEKLDALVEEVLR